MRARLTPAAVAAVPLQYLAPAAAFFPAAALGVLLILGSSPALARDYTLGTLRIEHPYARPTPPGARTGGAYLSIRNLSSTTDRLLRVASPAAQSVALHSMTMEGNLMKMREVAALDVPGGTTVTLGTGGYHIMLTGLVHPLDVGDEVPLTLTFERAGTIELSACVEAAPSQGTCSDAAPARRAVKSSR
jgi:periplasmic copper chaperone A